MQNEKIKAAVLLLKVKNFETDENGESIGEGILFEVRSENVPQPGEICLPGGHVEPGESPEDAAVRECFEEIGIPKEAIQVEGSIDSVKKLSGEKICTIVGSCDAKLLKTLKISEEEVSEIFVIPINWLKTHEIIHYEFTNIVDNCGYLPNILKNYLKRYNYAGETGYIEYEGHGIWGLTARILEHAIKEKFI